MPQTVELPGDRTVEFPDSMSEQEINAAISKAFPDLNGVDRQESPSGILRGLSAVGEAMAKNQLPTPGVPAITVPRVGEKGTPLRGVSEGVSKLIESATTPEGIVAGGLIPVPGVGKAVAGALIGLGTAATAQLAGEASVTHNPETIAEAVTTGLATALPLVAKASEMERTEFLQRGEPSKALPSPDVIARESLDPRNAQVKFIPQTKAALEETKGISTLSATELAKTAEESAAKVQDQLLEQLNKETNAEISQATEGEINAPQERPVQENIQPERAGNDALGPPAETGGGGSVLGETKVPEAAQETEIAQKQAGLSPEEISTVGAIATPGPALSPSQTGSTTLPVKGQHEIIQDLAKGLDLPIRFGRLTTSKFAGYFKRVQDLIGSKKANDIPTVSHEVGHKLDAHLNLSADPALAAELNVLGDPTTPGSRSSWTKTKTKAYKMGEGVGEFVRYWLTDPAQAQAMAPATHAAFERAMDANPDFGDVMRRAQEDIRIWRSAPDQARLRSHISIGDNPNGTPYRLRQLTRDLVDDLHILRVAVDDAERLRGAKLKPSQNVYTLARLLRGAYGRADVFVRDGIVDFKTKAVQLGTSLEDALKPIAGHVDDFRDWIVAKRAQELHTQGKETGLLPADVNATAARYDRVPEFQDAFNKVKAWQDSLVQYAQDAGLITDEGAQAMRDMHRDYVPFHRLFEVGAGEMSSQEGTGAGRGLNLGTPESLRRLKGSPRPIVDPLETMVKNAYVLTTAAEKAWIHAKLADLADSPGMGKWIERIAIPQELRQVTVGKLRKELESHGVDLTGIPDDLALTFFQNSRHAPFGENTIRITRHGSGEFYRLNRELFDTFHSLDLEDSGTLVRILSAPANLLRAGVTLAPDFALANAIRDGFSSAIVSRFGLLPFEATIRGVAAMIRRPELVSEWAAAGGKNSIEASCFDRTKLQKFLTEKITKDLTPLERATVIIKSPLVALRWLTGKSEEATRIGEYQVAFDKLRAAGMNEGDARTMAAFESRDRQDFSKGGAKTKIVRHMAAFWNAGLQANVRLAQSFKESPVATTLKGLAFITSAKMVEQALNYNDPDYWDRPQWERDLFFLIPFGKDDNQKTKFLRIPTPFEPGIIFGTLPGRMVQYLHEKDSSAFNGFANTVLNQAIPNPIPQSLQVMFEDFLSGKKGWDIFRGRQIVPESLADLPADLQWTEQTSLTAKHLGSLLGFSPMKIDHIINQSAGGVGKQLTHQVVDRAISDVTGEPRTAKGMVPGGRFVTSPAGIASQSVEDFYANLSKIEGERQRWKLTGKGQDWAALDSGFRKAAESMGKLRKAVRATDNDTEKQAYYIQMAEIAKDLNKVAKDAGVK